MPRGFEAFVVLALCSAALAQSAPPAVRLTATLDQLIKHLDSKELDTRRKAEGDFDRLSKTYLEDRVSARQFLVIIQPRLPRLCAHLLDADDEVRRPLYKFLEETAKG